MNFKIEISEKNTNGLWKEPYLTLRGFQTLDSAKLEVQRLIENFTQANVGPRRFDIRKGHRIQDTRNIL